MSCVWKGLMDALKVTDMSPRSFCEYIQSKNQDTPDMTWMGETLSPQLQQENKLHIDALDPYKVKDGYLCSTCDPLLLLVGQLYGVSIDHLYAGSTIRYKNKNAKTKIYVMSNQGHFWADKAMIKKQKKQDKKDKKRRKKKGTDSD